jgi:hypothetical protein
MQLLSRRTVWTGIPIHLYSILQVLDDRLAIELQVFISPCSHQSLALTECNRHSIIKQFIQIYIYLYLFFGHPYFTPDVILEPLTNRNFSYIKVFGICPSPRAAGGSHNLQITRQDYNHSATRWGQYIYIFTAYMHIQFFYQYRC